MSLAIRQCIPADRENVAAFLQSQPDAAGGPVLDAANLDFQSSLIATDGETVTGVALCFRSDLANAARVLSVLTRGDEPQLLRTLVDKAMGKLAARGLHKCKVICRNGQEPAELWGASQWPRREEATEAAAPSIEAPAV